MKIMNPFLFIAEWFSSKPAISVYPYSSWIFVEPPTVFFWGIPFLEFPFEAIVLPQVYNWDLQSHLSTLIFISLSLCFLLLISFSASPALDYFSLLSRWLISAVLPFKYVCCLAFQSLRCVFFLARLVKTNVYNNSLDFQPTNIKFTTNNAIRSFYIALFHYSVHLFFIYLILTLLGFSTFLNKVFSWDFRSIFHLTLTLLAFGLVIIKVVVCAFISGVCFLSFFRSRQ